MALARGYVMARHRLALVQQCVSAVFVAILFCSCVGGFICCVILSLFVLHLFVASERLYFVIVVLAWYLH